MFGRKRFADLISRQLDLYCEENADLLAAGPLPPARFNAIRARWQEVHKPDWIGQT